VTRRRESGEEKGEREGGNDLEGTEKKKERGKGEREVRSTWEFYSIRPGAHSFGQEYRRLRFSRETLHAKRGGCRSGSRTRSLLASAQLSISCAKRLSTASVSFGGRERAT